MYKIINRHIYEIASGENITLCDIVADSANDLPDAGDIALYKIAFGSFAFSIADKCFYCLNSSGTWVTADSGDNYYTKSEIDDFLDVQNMQIAQNTSDIANNGLKVVLSQQSVSTSTYTYLVNLGDFPLPNGCGCYLISIITWDPHPTYSLYSVAYSWTHTEATSVTKIAGSDASVTVSGDTISVTSTGKVTIMAMR